jgi:enolase-phosphatase E1
MTTADSEDPAKSILLDIEGTTTSVSFVYDILFPYARCNLKDFLLARIDEAEVRRQMDLLERERSDDLLKGFVLPAFASGTPEFLVDSVVSYAKWLMDLDRKSTPLKSIQGMIWESGYRSGELKGHVYEDVPRAMQRWRQQGRAIYIYSSGSVLAQKLLFAHSELGDLCDYIDGHFDTLVGPKRDPDSYRKIAEQLEHDSKRILFISDVTEELDSALVAGLSVMLAIRNGNPDKSNRGEYPVIRSFDELFA